MSTRYKPDAYPSLSPYLVVEDAEPVLAFMREVFDASDLRRHDRPDGSLMHAEVRIDDGVVMIGESPRDGSAPAPLLHLYVPDVDATYRRALAAGATSIREPGRQAGDADRRGGVRGPGGTQWWISTQVDEDEG